ncbi:carbohydrate-binding domain-containing protein [Clostridium sp. BJN0001]|uniref:carbohydrate-binding domain-containing protein n=1 Tax=Clostridium sp. BJN0001 TaxID=2930219 RepID=UPI001FD2BD61|nr:carbohydrate-binding domain-containing protein [Clostridium sp. BJN0001]
MKAKKIISIIISLSIISALVTGCSTTSAQNEGSSVESVNVTSSSDMFTDRDMEVGYDENECIKINLSDNDSSCSDSNVKIDGNIITITKEGNYIITGELTEGQIIVETEKTEKVQLILDNANISNSSSAPIYVKESDKVFITTAEDSNNVLNVNGEFKNDSEENIDSCVFSKADLTLNGRGTLEINDNYGSGITSKDDLTLTSGTYKINALNHGLEGKDSVRIANGEYDIVSGKDGINSDNDEDESTGYVYIEDGSINISAEDDGIHSSSAFTFNGGNINISKSYEGIEGKTIDINGGTINLVASDDGLNATSGQSSSGGGEKNQQRMQGAPVQDMQKDAQNSEQEDAQIPQDDAMTKDDFKGDMMGKGGMFEAEEGVSIKITGGKTCINAKGDGIDSNGTFEVTGGETYVSGPSDNGNGALDYNGEATITGGILVAAGSSGMAQNFGENSSQGSMLVTTSSMQTGSIIVKDSSGNELINYTPDKEYNCAVLSMKDIVKGETYTVTLGSDTQEITMEDTIYSDKSNQAGTMGMGMRQKGDKMNNADMKAPTENS